MALTTTVVQERRRFQRSNLLARLTVNMLAPQTLVSATHVNVSEGGVCLQLQEMLEIRSLVRLQTYTRPSIDMSAQCTGPRNCCDGVDPGV